MSCVQPCMSSAHLCSSYSVSKYRTEQIIMNINTSTRLHVWFCTRCHRLQMNRVKQQNSSQLQCGDNSPVFAVSCRHARLWRVWPSRFYLQTQRSSSHTWTLGWSCPCLACPPYFCHAFSATDEKPVTTSVSKWKENEKRVKKKSTMHASDPGS